MNPIRRYARKIAGFFQRRGPRIASRIGRYQWIDSGEWATVNSSWVAAIRYVKKYKYLYVRFHKSGAVCKYRGVSESVAEQMFRAASLGRFVHSHLRSFTYTRVD